VFALLTARYGMRWTRLQDDDRAFRLGCADWERHLADLSREEIDAGFELDAKRQVQAMNDGRECWPLGPAEFAALCRPRTVPAHRPFQRLPKPKVDKQIAAAGIEAMRRALRS
jgi:hypothetical protein